MEIAADSGKTEHALAEARRREIVDALRVAPNGLDTNALAGRLGLHPNTVRWHLGILADAGLVRSAPERRSGRGRPSVVYRLTAEGVVHGRDEYQLLATMLADLAAGTKDGEARAYETGRRWGRVLVERPSPSHTLPESEALATVVALLDEHGFDAQLSEGAVTMHRCPFAALAETKSAVVCTLHRGLIDGALEEIGSPLGVAQLDAVVEPGLCVAHLERS